jgi:hypothetical protein
MFIVFFHHLSNYEYLIRGQNKFGGFMGPLMVGAEGFWLIYLPLISCGISVILVFTFFLIWAWKILVGSILES